MGLVSDIAAGMLRGAGRPDLADWVKHAPEKVGEQLGKIFSSGLRSDGTIAPETINIIEELKGNNPSQSPPAAPNLLSEYLSDLNAIAARASAHEAIAIKGFLHCGDCLVIWHFTKQPHSVFQEDKSDQRIYVYGSGVDIYIGRSVDDQELTDLNLRLEKDESAIKAITETHCEFKVRYITKNDVALSVLRPTHKGKDEATAEITDPRGIVEAMRTLTIASEAQSKRIQDWKDQKKHP